MTLAAGARGDTVRRVRAWPPIEDPDVLAWLALDHEGWQAVLRERIRAFGARPFDDAAYRRAIAYPWERPAGSYAIRGGEVELLAGLAPDERRELVSAFASRRSPLVAFGANGAPGRLKERFAGFDDPDVLVLTGWLHEVDIGPQPTPTAFGHVPGALFASPGTAVRAAVLWVTAPQLAMLTKWELSYRLGRLDRAHFEMDEADVEVEDLFAYVSRVGVLPADGAPLALAAVPARDRRAREVTQEELLELVGEVAIGPGTTAADVVRMCHEDMPALLARAAPVLWPRAVRLPDDHWTPYPVP